MRRRTFLAALGAGATGIAGHAFGLEPARLTVSRHRIGTGSAPFLRLVQLSDLHLRELDDHVRAVATTTAALEPGLVLFTGDTVDRRGRLDVLRRFLDLLPDVPPLAILGNWEWWGRVDLDRMGRLFRRRGGWLLVNERLDGVHRGAPFEIVGLDDQVGGEPDPAVAAPRPDAARRRVLLEHCPGYRDVVELRGFDAILSGHTHGGQVTLPGWAPVLPEGSGGYVEGWYRSVEPPMYVSRGIGTTVVPARLFCPPEIAVFDWGLGGASDGASR